MRSIMAPGGVGRRKYGREVIWTKVKLRSEEPTSFVLITFSKTVLPRFGGACRYLNLGEVTLDFLRNELCALEVPVGTQLLYTDNGETFLEELGEEGWVLLDPSTLSSEGSSADQSG